VLSWLLGEPAAEAVATALEQADQVVASELTLVECRRALLRAGAAGLLSELEVARRSTVLERSAQHWTLVRIDREVLDRAGNRFPVEPLRTLDALHLASAQLARPAVADLAVLSFDQRVRDNGAALGFDLLPA
jgi:predicted nucleic acid-binding protein